MQNINVKHFNLNKAGFSEGSLFLVMLVTLNPSPPLYFGKT